MAQNDSVFRQKAIDNMSSPDELTDYLKVTNPGVWVILVAVVVLLAGIIAWACVGTLPTRADAKVIVRDGTAAILVDEPYVAAEGMTVTVGNNDCSVTSTVTDEYGEIVGHASTSLPDGVYDGKAIVDETRAIDFLLQGN